MRTLPFLIAWALLAWGCIDQVQRVCEEDANCKATKTRSVCVDKRCVEQICEVGATEACYTGPSGTQDKGPCVAGLRLCILQGTAWSPCQGELLPGVEVCDGKDNDCDGKTDEDLTCDCKDGQQRECYTGAKAHVLVAPSPCRRGVQVCAASKWGPCAGQVLPFERLRYALQTRRPAELPALLSQCLTVDGDCDGQVDANPLCSCTPGKSRPCADLGPCAQDRQSCVANPQKQGFWGFCSFAKQPKAEDCNGLDDDCDGQIDNLRGFFAPLTKPCPADCRVQICQKAAWGLCQKAELCRNGLDDDCDGKTDEADCRTFE